MNHKTVPLKPGLYLVATPIGNARDITLRALDVLASADVLAAEDTRTLRKLLDIHGVPLGNRKVVAYHDHSTDGTRNTLLAHILNGKSVAYASEAGTPLIADPGFKLVSEARSKDMAVTTAPGPSAAVAAVSLTSLASDKFLFAGFLPPQDKARRDALQTLLAGKTTLVLYESPKRLADLCKAISDIAGPDHPVAMCREITKRFEEVDQTTAHDLYTKTTAATPKGEIVLVVGPYTKSSTTDADLDDALRNALLTMRVKDAAEAVSGAFGLAKRDVYQRALALKDESKKG